MKKIYMKPETAMENVNVEQTIMTGSITWDDSKESGEGGINNGDATGDALGNGGGSLWDED